MTPEQNQSLDDVAGVIERVINTAVGIALAGPAVVTQERLFFVMRGLEGDLLDSLEAQFPGWARP